MSRNGHHLPSFRKIQNHLTKVSHFFMYHAGKEIMETLHSQQPLINNLGINLSKKLEVFYNETFGWKPPFSGLALIVSKRATQTAEGNKKHSIITKPINHMTGSVMQKVEIQKIQ